MAGFVFPEWTEKFKKLLGLLLVGAPVYLIVLAYTAMSAETLRIGYQPEQPVAYSHALHAGEMGMDCRYCHSTVEVSSHAAVPPLETCMGCHSRIRQSSKELKPIREAYEKGQPFAWVRVHDLPDYVFFNHSAHVTRGVGCETCHGRVDRMDTVYQHEALTMQWCLDCHNAPDKHLRPPDKVTVMGYQPGTGEGKTLRKTYNINPPTNCSTCHR